MNFMTPPCPVGYYVIGHYLFEMRERPRWLHRKMLELVFGIGWRDAA